MCKTSVSFPKKFAVLAAVFFTAANLHVFAVAPFTKLDDCHLIPNVSNDGDSFHVRGKGDEYIFRIYFVDAPETDKEFPDRVRDQAKYFGITSDQAVQIGKEAAAFTKGKLGGKNFTVYTRWQGALGRSKLPRYYAFIVVDNNQTLQELLVANGLARIFGTPTTTPSGQTPAAFIAHLRVLETKAKHDHLGAWSINASKTAIKTDDDWNSLFQKHTAPAQ
jgi:endonuclease YncB( thermonuclease family)